MAVTPWMTSTDIIESIKRKISFPISQNTFTEADILRFANEEMMISQVPSVMEFHEEYFVTYSDTTLEQNVNRYPIPDRAIGMKLRDIFYVDQSGNLFEMTRVSSEDRAFYQRNIAANEQIYKFYMEGNDVVLANTLITSPTGSLRFVFFLRPNQLVPNDRAAIITNFVETITVVNASVVAGGTVTIDGQVFTAVSGSPSTNEFQIGGSSIITATNLKTAINTNGIVSADNGSPSTDTITLLYSDLSLEFTTSNTAAFIIPDSQGIQFDQVPSNITETSLVDFLQTKPGHRTKAYDVVVPSNSISGMVIDFDAADVPSTLIVGDYICSANECIIPQIPPDLHNGLAERACARILAALGDQAGLQMSMAKIQEIEHRQGNLLDDRVEGAPQKIVARHSILRYNGMYSRRRL